MGRIAPVAGGIRQAILCQCVLLCRVAVSSVEEPEPAPATGLQACYNQCTGLKSFLTNLIEVRATNELDRAGTCLAFQGGFAHNKCVLDAYETCDMYSANISKMSENCLEIGIDIASVPENVTYAFQTCTMCQVSEGASGQRGYYDKPTLSECEAHCQQNELCESFDYDRTRSLCRTYEACPPSSQATRYGCQWTVYKKPDYVRPTRAPSESGIMPEGLSTTLDASSVKFSQDYGDRAVASAAAPMLRASGRWQALLVASVVASITVQRWLH